MKKQILLLTTLLAGFVSAETFTFQEGKNDYKGTSDAYIIMKKDVKTGAASKLQVQGYHCSACIDERTLIKFDLSSIPKETKIISATMKLFCTAQPRPGAATINMFQIKTTWEESSVNWNGWVVPNHNTDKDGFVGSYEYYEDLNTWHSADVLTAVQSWVANPSTNLGLELWMEPTMLTVSYASSEHATVENRPTLVIETAPTSIKSLTNNSIQRPISIVTKGKLVSLSATYAGSYQVELFSLSGKKLFDQSVVIGSDLKHSIDLSSTPAGMAVMRVSSNEVVHSQNILIQGR